MTNQTLETIRLIFEILANMATLLGVPIAIWLFAHEKRRERLDREYGTYDALDEKYLDYLKLCLEYPDLDVYDYTKSEIDQFLSKENQKIEKNELILFTILISIFERSFLMYKDQSTSLKKEQWAGWDEYMRDYAARGNFRLAWKILGTQFDTNFLQHMNQIMLETKANNLPKSQNNE
ncbi:MAG: hypothetical protein DHS20C20_09860 [Ardenticatenaceae bacterium]|nr:MAG: hypothetical protein DHS20C20_09860 [Ardenticatenaceae bacterium]